MTTTRFIAFALLAVLAVPSLAQATVGPGDTRISVGREGVDGSAGREHLAGKVVVRAPSDWTRTSNDTAPTAKFSASHSSACSARIEVSVRAAATRQPPRTRAGSVTQVPPASVIADNSRPGGWLRVVQLSGYDSSRHTYQLGVYGIASVRIAHNRLVDVRAFVWFWGCSAEQIHSGPASTGLRVLLHDARIHARIVRSHTAPPPDGLGG